LATHSFAMTGEQILEKMDDNRDHRTVSAKATMEIHVGEEVRTKTMRIRGVTEGSLSVVEFTNPEDRGTKYLMRGDDLWIYFPDEDDVVKISGHMLKEGMMGSDVSYEDALEADLLSGKYDISVAGEDTLDGKPCSIVELDAKVRDVPYYKRKMWVDKETFVAWKEERYAKSGKLLKVARVLEVEPVGGRHFPVKSEMVHALRKDSKTIFEMRDIELDVEMDRDLFTLRYLRR
jgi:outer membrane lipoprotein-sorting protein